mmetsp:Transcript_13607/g.29985  ORF Transcript_13607/g.29985 Transcript_13607/m.29985 type:complete len:1122 (-) Transcript_13607:216-3581(-)|eukprot:CAMPEP_0170593744 /NCGR_PEP_ID=MMETSP0224-20130122/13623_1 /TAXON_ID=285029 /ORGANISM="Togula jolla, Strain CCCM 725" /LENGTH=1121 /DNA_ID=CAMNT_0010917741 /DNA_START=42 /DNA_END=3407 /DNA_ORIENTATION=-
MEIVLEAAEGCPEDSVLSIKVGDTKRQAPIARLGQPFRFSTAPAQQQSLKVELLMPAAPCQTVNLNPAIERFSVHFGGQIRVTLQQRGAPELLRAPVNLGEVAESRGLPAEKLQMAQTAAAYLEKHDLVKIFQDILHGLLVNKPQDPMRFIEEKLSQSKLAIKAAPEPPSASAAKSRPTGQTAASASPPVAAAGGGRMGRTPTEDSVSGRGGPAMGKRNSMRGATGSVSKVEALLETLQMTHANLPLIIPFLPAALRDLLFSDDLIAECKRQFKALDTNGRGKLAPEDLLPVIVQLSTERAQAISEKQCLRFVQLFDANEDGLIEQDEFSTLLQFVIITSWLESEEGKHTLSMAQLEEQHYKDFIAMIEENQERLWSIIPFLPEWLINHITSVSFQSECIAHFKALDTDHNEQLDPLELLPVIERLSQAHPLIIDYEKCQEFVRMFDVHQNGTILQDEFFEFAQFLTVLNFLSTSTDANEVERQAKLTSQSEKTLKLIKALEKYPNSLPEVMHSLPKMLVDLVTGSPFTKACNEGFDKADKQGKGILGVSALFPVITGLCDKLQLYFSVSYDDFKKHQSLLDLDGRGLTAKRSFEKLARFTIVVSYLLYVRGHQEMEAAEIFLGKEKVEELLQNLKHNTEAIWDTVPHLPTSLKKELMSPKFAEQCMRDFKSLDVNQSGVLEAAELLPLVKNLSDAHQYSLTQEHCRHFLDIFDSERNGVITAPEFLNFARFMMIMAYMNTDEGMLLQDDMDIVKGQDLVEELLLTMEKDRQAIHTVIPMVPQDIYDQLFNSETFVKDCHRRFKELDKDLTNVLRPHELYPIVVELSGAHPWSVSEDQCERFIRIFDLYGDGVLREDEFLDFARFLLLMSYINSDEGRASMKEAKDIMKDTMKIEDLLKELSEDRNAIQHVIPYLPHWIRDELLSEAFTMECMETFSQLDQDRNNVLTPNELMPVVLAMSKAHHLSLNEEQCKRFTDIFDDLQNGVITRGEFVNFARFLMVMGYLKSQEGQAVRQIAMRDTSNVPQRPSSPPGQNRMVPASLPATLTPSAAAAANTGHLAVDVEFYQKKSEKLNKENQTLREKMSNLEQTIRLMESRLEEQEMRLRHAEVDLRASGSGRLL